MLKVSYFSLIVLVEKRHFLPEQTTSHPRSVKWAAQSIIIASIADDMNGKERVDVSSVDVIKTLPSLVFSSSRDHGPTLGFHGVHFATLLIISRLNPNIAYCS